MAGRTKNHMLFAWARLAWIAVMLVLLAGPVFAAWEFSMTGEYEQRLRYFSRTGNNDLFGNVGLQEGAWSAAQVIPNVAANNAPGVGLNANYVGFAGPRIYNRGASGAVAAENSTNLITRGGFSTWGSDALVEDQRVTFVPTIKVNEAIRVYGTYTIGGYRNKFYMGAAGVGLPPFERYYMHQVSSAAYNTAAIGSWEQIRATFNTPWATFSIGVKDFPLGTGLNLSYITRANAFLTIVPYGPFRFMHGWWLARGDDGWNKSPDGLRAPSLFQGYLFTYRSGSLEVGGGEIWQLNHASGSVGSLGFTQADTVLQLRGGYFKFSNGRIFANGEYFWRNLDVYVSNWNPAAAPFNGGATQNYRESYNLMLEAGAVLGPMKTTLLWIQSSGPVANINNSALAFNPAVLNGRNPKQYIGQNCNYTVLEPYEFLMFNQYGGGNQTFNLDGTGEMSDAYAFAGRLDYAVASNLNIWGSYIWAHRLEQNGYLFGQWDSTGGVLGGTGIAPLPVGAWTYADAVALRGLYGGSNPFVGNGFIGWEAGAGVDWKLLEGLTFKTRYAYWAPGDFFGEAWRAIGVRDVAGVGTPVNNAMFLARDPIQAIAGSILIDF